MPGEHQIIGAVYAAKEDAARADELVRTYLPFIRAEACRCMGRVCREEDDEHSIAMMAFYEAVLGYERGRGAFLSYAALLIRSRLVDFARREARHGAHLSLDGEQGDEDERSLLETLPDQRDDYEALALRDATRQEIEELSSVMGDFGVSFTDVSENCPKQERTRQTIGRAVRCAVEAPELLQELLRTKKLPLAALVERCGVERKTLERHRKYLLAMLLVQTNGYEIIRGHLKRVLAEGEVTGQ